MSVLEVGVCFDGQERLMIGDVCQDGGGRDNLRQVNRVKSLSSGTLSEEIDEMWLMESRSHANVVSNSSSNSHTTSINDIQNVKQGQPPELVYENNVKPVKTAKNKKDLASIVKGMEKTLEYFKWVDPLPAHPPSYKHVNPNRRIRFPVYETAETYELPSYSPAVDEITVVSLKQEWLNPYEPPASRAWMNFIMEINSTQLNFYHIHESLTKGIKNYYGGPTHLFSDFKRDKSPRFLSSLHARGTYQFNRSDQEWLKRRIKSKRSQYLSNEYIFKSFSLQFARFGIPTDYTKKTFVLRLRCELQQFLVNFAHVDDMIDWSVHLSTGIGVSLDLNYRELPNYRTVPRRRRASRRRRRRRRRRERRTQGEIGGESIHPRLTTELSDSAVARKVLHVGHGSPSKSTRNTTKFRRHSSASVERVTFGHDAISLTGFSRPSMISSLSSDVVTSSSTKSKSVKNLSSERKIAKRSKSYDPTVKKSESLPSSRRGSSSSLKTFKVKISTMFSGHGKKSSFSSASNKSNAATLDCVIEDDNEEAETSESHLTDCKEETGKKRDLNVEKAPKHGVVKEDLSKLTFGEDQGTKNVVVFDDTLLDRVDPQSTFSSGDSSIIHDNELLSQTGFHNVSASRFELQELQNIIDEHNNVSDEDSEGYNEIETNLVRIRSRENLDEEHAVEDEEEDEEEDEDEDEDEDDNEEEEELDGANMYQAGVFEPSIYEEEGIYHENDSDYIYLSTERRRTSSITSQISSTPYGSDEIKWSPPRKEITRRRYIRDSLRCIKPLPFNDSWIGKIALAPSTGPSYSTNNPPISGFTERSQLKQKNIFSLKRMNSNEPVVLVGKCKNHYLTPYIVGPVALSRALPN